MPGDRARSALAAASGPGRGGRFADVRWVAETGSTNADGLALLRDGGPEGVVLVADHQTAGRGRRDRSWEARPEAALLASVTLRPPAAVVEACTMAVAVAAVQAVAEVAGFSPRIKWPNDLVWPGDRSAPDRKLAGILAEADWPAGSTPDAGYRPPRDDERIGLVVGIGINVTWGGPPPEHLADTAVAITEVTGAPVDREDLLVSLLRHLDDWYGPLVAARDVAALKTAWRLASATLGRRVRVDTGRDDVVGTAVDVDGEGHLVVDTLEGERRTLAVGDVVHLREADEGPGTPY